MRGLAANLFSIAILACASLVTHGARANDASAEDEVDLVHLRERLERLRARYGAPGVALVAVKGDRIVFLNGFGERDIAGDLPVTPDTVFPVASVTKQFTAALAGIHAGKGQLSLNERPGRYLPELRFADPALDRQITIADLLSHRSGIGNLDATHVLFPTSDLDRHLRRLRFLQPDSGYRERFDYSNMGYAVAAAVTEAVGRQSWSTQIQTMLFDPLRMTRSTTGLAAMQQQENVATGYAMTQGQPFAVLHEDQHEAAPSGGINSTVRDLGNWLSLLLAKGQFAGEEIVPADFLASAFSAHVMINPTYNPRTRDLFFDGYGFGWFTGLFEGHYRVSHGGNTSGFTARVDLLPGAGIGVAVLTNQQSSELPRYAADLIYREFLGLPERAIPDYPLQVTDGVLPPTATKARTAIPSGRSAADYAGTYSHPGYGSFTITQEGGNLLARFPAFTLMLEHEADDVFVTRRAYETHQNVPDFPVLFTGGNRDGISAAEIPFQAEQVRFLKEPVDD